MVRHSDVMTIMASRLQNGNGVEDDDKDVDDEDGDKDEDDHAAVDVDDIYDDGQE